MPTSGRGPGLRSVWLMRGSRWKNYALLYPDSPSESGISASEAIWQDWTFAVGSGVNVAANPEALALTIYGAVISNDVNVNSNGDALALTTHAASVSVDVNILAGVEALATTTYSASVAVDVNVMAGVATLTLTAHRGDVAEVTEEPESSFSGGWYEWTPIKKKRKDPEPVILEEVEQAIEQAEAEAEDAAEAKAALVAVRQSIVERSVDRYIASVAELAEGMRQLDARLAQELRLVQEYNDLMQQYDDDAIIMLLVA